MEKVVLAVVLIATFALTGCQKDESNSPAAAATPQVTNCPPGMSPEYCAAYSSGQYQQPYNGQYNQYPYNQYPYNQYPYNTQYYGCPQGTIIMNVSSWGQAPRYACVPSTYFFNFNLYFRWGFQWGSNYNYYNQGYGPAQYCNPQYSNSCGGYAQCRPVPGLGAGVGVCCYSNSYSGSYWGR